ncbi:MAG: hypothetical protein KC653_03295, partial [Candidatus Andersenbacteria bacterium]|nr:hypothetical protein [Candidatus Andersenbacteria bacterium]
DGRFLLLEVQETRKNVRKRKVENRSVDCRESVLFIRLFAAFCSGGLLSAVSIDIRISGIIPSG